MPPSITLEMAKGFTLYMVKALISGRGDEIVDLARSNLWRSGVSDAITERTVKRVFDYFNLLVCRRGSIAAWNRKCDDLRT